MLKFSRLEFDPVTQPRTSKSWHWQTKIYTIWGCFPIWVPLYIIDDNGLNNYESTIHAMFSFLRISLKNLLCIFLCDKKKIKSTPSLVITIWTKLNLHYLWMLSDKLYPRVVFIKEVKMYKSLQRDAGQSEYFSWAFS